LVLAQDAGAHVWNGFLRGHCSRPEGPASGGRIASPSHALGISTKDLTYLCFTELSSSGELGGDTSSSGYEVSGGAYWFREIREVIGLWSGCE